MIKFAKRLNPLQGLTGTDKAIVEKINISDYGASNKLFFPLQVNVRNEDIPSKHFSECLRQEKKDELSACRRTALKGLQSLNRSRNACISLSVVQDIAAAVDMKNKKKSRTFLIILIKEGETKVLLEVLQVSGAILRLSLRL